MRMTDNVYDVHYVIEGVSAEGGKNKTEAKKRLRFQLEKLVSSGAIPSPYGWKVKMKRAEVV
jgi:hypothetical protein